MLVFFFLLYFIYGDNTVVMITIKRKVKNRDLVKYKDEIFTVVGIQYIESLLNGIRIFYAVADKGNLSKWGQDSCTFHLMFENDLDIYKTSSDITVNHIIKVKNKFKIGDKVLYRDFESETEKTGIVTAILYYENEGGKPLLKYEINSEIEYDTMLGNKKSMDGVRRYEDQIGKLK